MTFPAILSERWNRLRQFDKNLIFYWSILSVLILIFHHNLNDPGMKFSLHIGLIGLVFLVIPWLDSRSGSFWRFLRYWYIIISLPFLYFDAGSFLHMVFPGEFDHLILGFETALFGVLPNIWIQKLVNPVLTEIMQISYGIYWITIPLGAAVFYFQKKDRHLAALLHYVTLTFFISYFIFMFFPVAGPRFVLADSIQVSYEGLFITKFLRGFMTQVGYRGGAFPSSHVAVAVVILTFVWHFRPGLAKKLFLPLVVALSMATIYGQYHYLTDVIFGFAMGMTIGITGARRTRRLLGDYSGETGIESRKISSTST